MCEAEKSDSIPEFNKILNGFQFNKFHRTPEQ